MEINDIIEGTINCWQIEAKESCDLPYQLKLMVGDILESIGRKITERASRTKFAPSFPIGAKTLELSYTCLFGTSHTIQGETFNELNFKLSNHACECHTEESLTGLNIVGL